ncbi:type II toxin-antitoxin system YafQ family toxin [uncultured Parabacteroides sp.]|uniref:type II toxin-antitoxin system YafQ family toxin n=1 Tax=uncultured Parabacteroides sp. TaxID=512312 RepID=UPI00261FFA36|nr:type II toxin-antitoxin system YafQ family toxin [uncultured Parabacteroides sp.]
MKYTLEFTHQYLKDLKQARRRQLDESKLNDIILLLMNDKELPAKNKDHALKGNYKGCRECHITPDWLLIYKRDEGRLILALVRNGSHSDLF